MWWKLARTGVSQTEFDRIVKQYIRTTPFFTKLFSHYDVDIKQLFSVIFGFARLNGLHAETRGDTIVMDEQYLVSHGMKNSMHLIAHELVHWLTRQREKENYFADPEEVQGFTWAIAHELSSGHTWDHIEDTFLPIIQAQIPDPHKARLFLIQRFKDARSIGFKSSSR